MQGAALAAGRHGKTQIIHYASVNADAAGDAEVSVNFDICVPDQHADYSSFNLSMMGLYDTATVESSES